MPWCRYCSRLSKWFRGWPSQCLHWQFCWRGCGVAFRSWEAKLKKCMFFNSGPRLLPKLQHLWQPRLRNFLTNMEPWLIDLEKRTVLLMPMLRLVIKDGHILFHCRFFEESTTRRSLRWPPNMDPTPVGVFTSSFTRTRELYLWRFLQSRHLWSSLGGEKVRSDLGRFSIFQVGPKCAWRIKNIEGTFSLVVKP